MLKKNINKVNRDIKTLVSDAQELLLAAASLSGEKAEEMRHQGTLLMDAALLKAQETHAHVLAASKKKVASADQYVKENPWRAIATSTGIGLVLGVLFGRR